MKKTTFSKRLRAIIEEKNLRQIDLCQKTGIGKSAMSQYLRGSFEPKQQNLHALAEALNVSEAWLMGYDVPRARPPRGQLGIQKRLFSPDSRFFLFYCPGRQHGKCPYSSGIDCCHSKTAAGKDPKRQNCSFVIKRERRKLPALSLPGFGHPLLQRGESGLSPILL